MKVIRAKIPIRFEILLIGCLFAILRGSTFAASGLEPVSLIPASGVLSGNPTGNAEVSNGQATMFNPAVTIEQTTVFSIIRTTPSPFPNSSESCSVSINGEYAKLSTSPGGPFYSTLTNVELPSDASGFGRTATLYIRGIEPIENLAMYTTCQRVIIPITYWDVLAALRLHISYSGKTIIGVGESRLAALQIDYGVPNYVGTVDLSVAMQSSAPRYFGLSPVQGAFQNLSSLSIPVALDSNGSGSVAFRFKGLEASPDLQGIFARFSDGESNGFTSTLLDIVRIERIWFERASGEVPIDNNPHIGGGQRVFPEKKTPTDSSFHRDKVIVKAQLSQPKSLIHVNFKVFDVDDPEIVVPEDTNGAVYVDFNGTLGNDNRGVTAVYPFGTLGYTDSSGIASMYVQVSPQPGDNFRIGATVNADTVSGVNDSLDSVRVSETTHTRGILSVVAGTNLADSAGNVLTETGNPRAAAVATKMLTTWRRLHIEADSMGAITGNFLTGQIVDTTPVSTSSTKLTTNLTMEKGRFGNGRIELTQAGVTKSCNVTLSVINTVTVPCAYTDSLIGATFRLYDDDDMNGNDASPDGDNGEDVPAPDLRLLKDVDNFDTNLFAWVYIRPTYDLAGNRSDLPVFINTPRADPTADYPTDAEFLSMTEFNNDATRKDKEYWTSYILQAYQYHVQSDEDPLDDATANGFTRLLGVTNSAYGSICFQESLSESTNHVLIPPTAPEYEFYLDWADTPIHELMHQLRANDGDGGRIDGDFGFLSGQSQDRIRRSKVPSMADAP